jgi:Holliday junction resolvase-like predicted endonuclease
MTNLNELNGSCGISAPYKSVPVMKLIREHNPKSRSELSDLIKYHYENDCSCGIKSQGTVEDFGNNLYNAQLHRWGTPTYTLEQCIEWEYDLFVTKSLQGNRLEKKAIEELQKKETELLFEEASGYLDEEVRVDIVVMKDKEIVCGIQVKPETYKIMRQGIKEFNKNANSKLGKPVHYLYYNKKEDFVNINELTFK